MSLSPHPSDHSEPAPAAGEDIHLPGPTILPLVSAIGITLIVIGTTLGWLISIVGGVILLVAAVRWIADTRRDIAALPDRHE